ncbi:unnamed protein product, partial [Allacma fusca]
TFLAYSSQGLYASAYHCYPTYYMSTCALPGSATGASGSSQQTTLTCTYDPHTVYYNQALLSGLTTSGGAAASIASSQQTQQLAVSTQAGFSYSAKSGYSGARQSLSNSAKASHTSNNYMKIKSNSALPANPHVSAKSSLLAASNSKISCSTNDNGNDANKSTKSPSSTNNNPCPKIIPVVHLTVATTAAT